MAWTWQWHPHPEVWLLVAVLVGGYELAVQRLAPAGSPGATSSQRKCWYLAAGAILLSSEWPLHDLSEGYLYSAHMVQHLILTLVAPPLLLLGVPAWLVRRIFPPRAMRVLRALCRPFVALVLFNVVTVLTHWPLLVNASLASEPIHFAIHTVLVLSSMAMWMPVFSPVLELPRLSLPGQMLYLFLQSLVPTVPASFLTFGDKPLYAVYATLPKLWGLSALDDQRTAGLIMKLVGGAILWGVITVVFFRWARTEQRDGVDLLGLHDIDTTMNRMELTR